MPPKASIFLLSLFLACSGTLLQAAVTMKVDTVSDLTLVLQNFNGSTDPSTGFGNNTGQPRPTFVESVNGVATYTVQPSTITEGVPYPSDHDPQIRFPTQTYNVHEFNHVRVRQSYHVDEGVTLNRAPSSEMWPLNPMAPTTVSLGSLGSTLNEYRAVWRNPADPSISTATTGGFRWDPVVGGVTNATPLYFNLDYVMVDRGRVIGFEFDSSGSDATQHRLNFSPAQIDTGTIRTENGALKGTTSGSDPYVLRGGLNVDTSIYKFVELRMRRDAANPTSTSDVLQLFWSNNGQSFSEANSYKVKPTEQHFDGDWHTYLFDFSQDTPSWTGAIQSIRVDLGTMIGAEFEIDYLRFRELGAVPEPSKGILCALGLAMSLLSRRRKS